MYTPAPATLDADFDSSAYGLIDLGEASPDISGERWLFLWVILQALVNIGMVQPPTSGRRPGVKRLDRADIMPTLQWLLRDRRDFFFVCELAGGNRPELDGKMLEPRLYPSWNLAVFNLWEAVRSFPVFLSRRFASAAITASTLRVVTACQDTGKMQ
jgi:hypothetical protein